MEIYYTLQDSTNISDPSASLQSKLLVVAKLIEELGTSIVTYLALAHLSDYISKMRSVYYFSTAIPEYTFATAILRLVSDSGVKSANAGLVYSIDTLDNP